MTLSERAESLLLATPPKGPVQPAWLDEVIELLREIAAIRDSSYPIRSEKP